MPRVEDLVEARWFSVILVNHQIQVYNLFVDRFRLKPLADQGDNGQNNSHKQTIKNHWPTKQPKLGNSSESGRIATKWATYLRAVGSRPTDQTIGQIQA